MGKELAPPEFLVIGRIVAPWGIKGEVKVEVLTDFPERLAPRKVVYLNNRPLEIERCRSHKQLMVVKLASIDSVEAAEKLRGQELKIPGSELYTLPEGQYYAFQLIGLKVVTAEGKTVGRIKDIMTTPSNDVYLVEGKRSEILIPEIGRAS